MSEMEEFSMFVIKETGSSSSKFLARKQKKFKRIFMANSHKQFVKNVSFCAGHFESPTLDFLKHQRT
jgi:hypothetical protein